MGSQQPDPKSIGWPTQEYLRDLTQPHHVNQHLINVWGPMTEYNLTHLHRYGGANEKKSITAEYSRFFHDSCFDRLKANGENRILSRIGDDSTAKRGMLERNRLFHSANVDVDATTPQFQQQVRPAKPDQPFETTQHLPARPTRYEELRGKDNSAQQLSASDTANLTNRRSGNDKKTVFGDPGFKKPAECPDSRPQDSRQD